MTDISDRDLLKLVVDADDELMNEGVAPPQRTIQIISKVMPKLGFASFILAGSNTPLIVKRISSLHSSLYRPKDIAVGGIHGGIFMFRDVFARISIPFAYGRAKFEPLQLTDLSPMQLQWLATRSADMQMFIDQFIDVFDFAGGVGHFADFKRPPKQALEIFWLAAFQLQAAAAALSVAFDFRGAVQSALIGAELAIKGGLAAAGVAANIRKKHGHDLASAAATFAISHPNLDTPRVVATIKRMPRYVDNRYSATQPDRTETGHIVMGAQYLAGEVMRQVSGHTIRSSLTPPSERIYPPI